MFDRRKYRTSADVEAGLTAPPKFDRGLDAVCAWIGSKPISQEYLAERDSINRMAAVLRASHELSLEQRRAEGEYWAKIAEEAMRALEGQPELPANVVPFPSKES